MLRYINNQLYIEKVSCLDLVKKYKTPLYVYSRTSMLEALTNYRESFSELRPLICYAVKANSNLSILQHFSRLSTGFDVVSGGELQRVLTVQGNPKKIVFSGVNKSEAEIQLALQVGILTFNVESIPEIDRIQKVAKSLGVKAPISLRINPNIDAKTHPHISTGLKNNKFGIPYEQALEAYSYSRQQSHLNIVGIDCHIGSQLTDVEPLKRAADKLFTLVAELKKKQIPIRYFDSGGGLGIIYCQEPRPDYKSYAQHLSTFFSQHPEIKLILEPGRSLVGDAGILLTRVDYIKQQPEKNFIIVDAAMNDLIRPALYDGYHDIIPVSQKPNITPIVADIVGPICETSDCLGKNRKLAVEPGDYLAIKSTGAYVASMANHYNSRLIAAEVWVHDDQEALIRQRDQFSQLIQNELPFIESDLV